MSTSYLVTYAEPRLFMLDGTPRQLLHARVTGTAHRDEQSARRELAALSACYTEPLELVRVLTFDDDRGPCAPASSTRAMERSGPDAVPALYRTISCDAHGLIQHLDR